MTVCSWRLGSEPVGSVDSQPVGSQRTDSQPARSLLASAPGAQGLARQPQGQPR